MRYSDGWRGWPRARHQTQCAHSRVAPEWISVARCGCAVVFVFFLSEPRRTLFCVFEQCLKHQEINSLYYKANTSRVLSIVVSGCGKLRKTTCGNSTKKTNSIFYMYWKLHSGLVFFYRANSRWVRQCRFPPTCIQIIYFQDPFRVYINPSMIWWLTVQTRTPL